MAFDSYVWLHPIFSVLLCFLSLLIMLIEIFSVWYHRCGQSGNGSLHFVYGSVNKIRQILLTMHQEFCGRWTTKNTGTFKANGSSKWRICRERRAEAKAMFWSTKCWTYAESAIIVWQTFDVSAQHSGIQAQVILVCIFCLI